MRPSAALQISLPPHCRPAPSAEFQPYPQAAVLIGRQGVGWNADTTTEPLPRSAITDDHQTRQCHAVVAQLHRMPSCPRRPQLPAIAIAPQTGHCQGMTEQDVARHDPDNMGQTHPQQSQFDSTRHCEHQAGNQCQQMAHKAHHQQTPRRPPATFEPITWAGHGPESCEPCAAIRDLRTRRAP